MMTVRQIERLWDAEAYTKLYRELMVARPEASFQMELELGRAVPVAALALLRLDELCQSHTPVYGRLLRIVLAAQEADGGWGDLMTTALCLRALLSDNGQGQAIERGMGYLANLQKSEGIWPRVPIRRTPADPFVSAFILHQLGDQSQFRSRIRFTDAVSWFHTHSPTLTAEVRRLWNRAALRCRMHQSDHVFAWS